MQKRLLYLWILLTICITPTQAEVVVLRSGQQIKGEMLLNNDEVVIFLDTRSVVLFFLSDFVYCGLYFDFYFGYHKILRGFLTLTTNKG